MNVKSPPSARVLADRLIRFAEEKGVPLEQARAERALDSVQRGGVVNPEVFDALVRDLKVPAETRLAFISDQGTAEPGPRRAAKDVAQSIEEAFRTQTSLVRVDHFNMPDEVKEAVRVTFVGLTRGGRCRRTGPPRRVPNLVRSCSARCRQHLP